MNPVKMEKKENLKLEILPIVTNYPFPIFRKLFYNIRS